MPRMTKSDSNFLSALEGKKRQICIELLRQSPDMTLAELNQLSRGELGKLFATIAVSDLLNPDQQRDVAPAKAAPAAKQKKQKEQKERGGRRGGAKVAKSSAAEKPARGAEKADGKGEKAAKPARAEKPAEEAAGGPQEVNTRTPAGREAFDKAVFDALKSIGGYAGAGEIQKRVGGTNMQVRSAVNRLIEAGQVNWTGQARGTRYRVA
jgi:hypothetical protein